MDLLHRTRGGNAWAVLALVVALLVFAACGGAETPGPETGATIQQATLTCSQECADRGLCGVSPDRGRVVLLNREGPSVTAIEFDLAIAENSVAQIVEQRVETVVQVSNATPFEVTFFTLLVPDRQDSGWTAAWCLIQGTP